MFSARRRAARSWNRGIPPLAGWVGMGILAVALIVGLAAAKRKCAAAEDDHEHREREDVHVACRGHNRDAAQLMRRIVAHDERARTAHEVAAATEHERLPAPVGSHIDRRTKATQCRRRNYLDWQEQAQTFASDDERWRGQQVGRASSPDCSIEL